ncbi:MAG: ArsR family transcriptional regulator [bacterium]
MRTSAPALLAVFRSQLQGELLAQVMLASEEPTISDLASALAAPVSTVQREVDRLERAGILRTRKLGRGRLVSFDAANPAVPPLLELVAITLGPRRVVKEEFAGLAGINELYLFGSWAARYRGVEGKAPGDVDVLVVGQPDRDAVYDAADAAQRRLHREVNTTMVSAERWASADKPFLREIRSRPLVPVAAKTEGNG